MRRAAQPDAHALGELRRSLLVGARQQEKELLPAPAAREVRLAERVAEHLGEGPQDRVADGVAVLVVDVLEPVEVGEDDRERRLEALGASRLRVQRVGRPRGGSRAR